RPVRALLRGLRQRAQGPPVRRLRPGVQAQVARTARPGSNEHPALKGERQPASLSPRTPHRVKTWHLGSAALRSFTPASVTLVPLSQSPPSRVGGDRSDAAASVTRVLDRVRKTRLVSPEMSATPLSVIRVPSSWRVPSLVSRATSAIPVSVTRVNDRLR